MTKRARSAQVLGTPVVPPVEAFGVGYIQRRQGAKPDIKVLIACHPGGLAKGFTDPDWGKDDRNQMIDQSADVIFARRRQDRQRRPARRSPRRADPAASASTPTST